MDFPWLFFYAIFLFRGHFRGQKNLAWGVLTKKAGIIFDTGFLVSAQQYKKSWTKFIRNNFSYQKFYWELASALAIQY